MPIGLAVAVLATTIGFFSLVPQHPSNAPDYFCTWNIQGYACSYTGVKPTRAEMNESNLFGKGRSQKWLEFFPSVRRDLIFVMDDSWDVPPDGDERFLGRLELDKVKFPRYSGKPVRRLAQLVRDVKAAGWKGLGGWMCAQECSLLPRAPSANYWSSRLTTLAEGGMSYLKVDWGNHSGDSEWRRLLENLKPKCCPQITIEAAITPSALAFADTYRTYDVETVISTPVTLSRIANLLSSPQAQGSPTILNCEDEVYIGAGIGCAYGVMRHPLAGPLPDGRNDFVFPASCRDLKNRIDEVVRAVRWHRIASPFAAGIGEFHQSSESLTDLWTMGESETWMDRSPGSKASAAAPAILSRGLPLPKVTTSGPDSPFVVAAKYPNGCVSIATLGRALVRTYRTPAAKIEVTGASLNRPVGIFGHYGSLTLSFGPGEVPRSVWAQDLAGDRAVDITKQISFRGQEMTLSGDLVDKVGLSSGHKEDVSDPGMVLVARG